MSIVFNVTAGYFQVPALTVNYLMRKDTCAMNKTTGIVNIYSSSVFRLIQRYTDECEGGEEPCYVRDPHGDYYYNESVGGYLLYSTMSDADKEVSQVTAESYPPVPNSHIGLARWTVETDSINWWIEGLSDIRPSFAKEAGVFASTQTAPQYIAYTGGEMVMGDTGGNTIATQSGETAKTIRRTLNFPVDAGQYEVRLRRVSLDTNNNRIADQLVWTALRSFQVGAAITEPNMVRKVFRIRATDQLNGSVDNYNCIAQTVCQDYDLSTDTWVERTTSNPSALYRFVLQGPANKRPLTDSQIDIDSLEEWHTSCEEQHFEFNHYVDYRSSVDAVLKMVASAGRAAPCYIDGKYGVVMDQVQTNIAQHFTPRNSWDYSYNKIFYDRPHAFRVKFWNADEDWREDERIVYDDGFDESNATKFEELTLPGVTSSAQAYKHGRYHIATARLRPETHSFNVDFEYLTCTRGDRVKFTHDVIAVGIGYGRVKSYTDDGTNVLTITVDEELPMETGKTYQFRVRQDSGDSIVINLTTSNGYFTTFDVSDTLAIADAPDIDSLMMYGETDEESIDLIVKTIMPASDLTANVVCLAYAPEVHEAHLGTIPSFDTHITLPVDRLSIYKPVLSIRSDEMAIIVDRLAGTVTLRIIVTANTQQIPPGLIDKIVVRYRLAGTVNPWVMVETITNQAFLTEGIFQGALYEIQACYFIDFRQGLWNDIENHTVVGMSSPPADVTNFNSTVTSFGDILLEWTAVTDLDLSHYIIRYSSNGIDAEWEKSIETARVAGTATTVTIPAALDGTYLIKAVDLESRESENAALIITEIPALILLNVIEQINEDTAWSGTKESCYVANDKLILDMTGEWDGITDFDEWEGIDSYGGAATDGYYYPAETVSLSSVQTCRCGIEFDFYGVDSESLWDDILDFDAVTSFSSEVPGVGIQPQISLSDDNSTWTDWVPFVNGDYTARYFKFRLHLFSSVSTYYVIVNQFSITVDMMDRAERGQDVSISTSGTQISFTLPYIVPPIVRATIDNATAHDTVIIYGVTTTDFYVRVLDISGYGAARTIDWQSLGY